mmetsp:Transcript_90638/g.259200  ORF Transcript_90638/g.259200 Transcript_90638/m.259200 type:complete len:527 (+) Transcript_90638:57-1637(+)
MHDQPSFELAPGNAQARTHRKRNETNLQAAQRRQCRRGSAVAPPPGSSRPRPSRGRRLKLRLHGVSAAFRLGGGAWDRGSVRLLVSSTAQASGKLPEPPVQRRRSSGGAVAGSSACSASNGGGSSGGRGGGGTSAGRRRRLHRQHLLNQGCQVKELRGCALRGPPVVAHLARRFRTLPPQRRLLRVPAGEAGCRRGAYELVAWRGGHRMRSRRCPSPRGRAALPSFGQEGATCGASAAAGGCRHHLVVEMRGPKLAFHLRRLLLGPAHFVAQRLVLGLHGIEILDLLLVVRMPGELGVAIRHFEHINLVGLLQLLQSPHLGQRGLQLLLQLLHRRQELGILAAHTFRLSIEALELLRLALHHASVALLTPSGLAPLLGGTPDLHPSAVFGLRLGCPPPCDTIGEGPPPQSGALAAQLAERHLGGALAQACGLALGLECRPLLLAASLESSLALRPQAILQGLAALALLKLLLLGHGPGRIRAGDPRLQGAALLLGPALGLIQIEALAVELDTALDQFALNLGDTAA